MVRILYDTLPGTDASVDIPLGAARRYTLIVLASILTFVSLASTILFQRVSKKDNDLRQRGRYLVSLQGYFSTIFLTVICFFQAFKYRFPCVVLYYASYFGLVPFVVVFAGRAWRLITRFDRNQSIYHSRFAEPADLAALSTAHYPYSSPAKQSILVSTSTLGASDPSLLKLSSLQTQRPTRAQERSGSHGKDEKAFELTEKSAEEIADSKRWYNRYRNATDKQMLCVAVLYMVISTIIGVTFQVNTLNISIDPLSFNCHSGPEYIFPYATVIVFLFILSPIMIYQLKGINDGFGIRNELIFISSFSAPCVALYFLVPALAYDFTKNIMDRTTFMLLILIAAHIPSILIPLCRHYKTHPHQCAYTAKALQRMSRRRSKIQVIGASEGIKEDTSTDAAEGVRGPKRHPQAEGNSSGKSGTMPADSAQFQNNYLSPPTSPPPGGPFSIGEGHDMTAGEIPLDQYRRKNSFSNINISLKSLVKNQRAQRFGIRESNHHGAIINSKKTDWDEFIKALDDRRLFDRMSAFTVGEFCAENTRFLYEVSRLEKRALQYEHLRDLTATPQDAPIGAAGTDAPISEIAKPATGTLSKSPSTGTQCSIVPPLPAHFAAPAKQTTPYHVESGTTPHRIKKIVSASSVSSTVPMLAARPRRSSSSLFDEPEPSPSMGSFPHSTFKRLGSSTSALPDLEEGIIEQSGMDDLTITDPAPYGNIVNMPKTATFAPLPMPPTLLIQFEYVYKTFIARGGRLELNLSYTTAQEIHQKARWGEWSSGMFDGAIYEIQELLFRDVWPKFVTSAHGLHYNGSSTSLGPCPQQHQTETSLASSTRSSAYVPFESQPGSPQRTTPSPSIMLTTPKSSISRAATRKATNSSVSDEGNGSRRGSIGSSRTQQGRHEDGFYEEPSRSGLRTWLSKTSRTGYTAAALMSREGGTEEAEGIIEQSRKSMVDRRSDTSGLYSSSIQNSMAA